MAHISMSKLPFIVFKHSKCVCVSCLRWNSTRYKRGARSSASLCCGYFNLMDNNNSQECQSSNLPKISFIRIFNANRHSNQITVDNYNLYNTNYKSSYEHIFEMYKFNSINSHSQCRVLRWLHTIYVMIPLRNGIKYLQMGEIITLWIWLNPIL